MISDIFINDGKGKNNTSRNLQIKDVILAMVESEHCLFHNKDENLMYVEPIEEEHCL